MKVSDIISKCSFTLLVEADTERDITGVYTGDLLSWVMGHGEEGQCLVTIMSNVNVLAVASLLDLSCVILAENVKPDDEFIELAKEKEINVLSSSESAYTICTLLYEALK
ncbi:MAG: AraC family transcriptional regulator [Clostridia bacterium]|nr:AraC family transcriptional regulator [Clostridia bacterium]